MMQAKLVVLLCLLASFPPESPALALPRTIPMGAPKSPISPAGASTKPRFLRQEPAGLGRRSTALQTSLLPQLGPRGVVSQRPNVATAVFRALLHVVIVLRWRVKGLKVEVIADSNRKALSGTLRSVFLRFDRLELARAKFTSGGIIEVSGLDLTLPAFLRRLLWGRVRFVKRPFELFLQADLNRHDVANSWWVRNIAQRIVNILMTRAVGTDLTIVTISVRAASVVADRLVFSGVIGTALSSSVPFLVSIGLGVADSGHILVVTDPEIVLNPGPLQVVVPIVTMRSLEVDLGDNARIERLLVANSVVKVRARTLVTPHQKFLVSDPAPRTMFSYDLADFVSRFLGIRRLPDPNL